MLNDDKTEFLVIGTSKQLSKMSVSSIRVGDVERVAVADSITLLVAQVAIFFNIYTSFLK